MFVIHALQTAVGLIVSISFLEIPLFLVNISLQHQTATLPIRITPNLRGILTMIHLRSPKSVQRALIAHATLHA